MSLKERLESDIRDAMRSRNQERLEALRFLKSQIQLTEKNQLKDLDEAGVVDVVAKESPQPPGKHPDVPAGGPRGTW